MHTRTSEFNDYFAIVKAVDEFVSFSRVVVHMVKFGDGCGAGNVDGLLVRNVGLGDGVVDGAAIIAARSWES